MKITITVPQKENEKWLLGLGKRPRPMLRADTLFNRLERVLSRLTLKEKVSILVRYTKDIDNETVVSQDTSYLLYATSCFLEDYLSKKVLTRARNQYLDG